MNCIDDWKNLKIKNNYIFFQRWGASAIHYNGDIILFGGYSQGKISIYLIKIKKDEYLDQLLVMNIERLEFKEIKFNYGPSKRSNFSCVKYIKQNGEASLIIHGGINVNGELNDTFELNLENFKWKELETLGEIPVFSTEHSAEIYKDFMIVIGGEANDDLHDKIRILNLKTLIWKNFKPAIDLNQNLFMRIFHCSAIIDSKLFIYSGANTDYFCYNDLLEIDFINFNFEKNSNISNITVTSYDDFKYDKINNNNNVNTNKTSKYWITNKNSRYPYPRWGANMLVKNSNCLILFGGRNKKDFNDLWLYSTTLKKWFEVN